MRDPVLNAQRAVAVLGSGQGEVEALEASLQVLARFEHSDQEQNSYYHSRPRTGPLGVTQHQRLDSSVHHQ